MTNESHAPEDEQIEEDKVNRRRALSKMAKLGIGAGIAVVLVGGGAAAYLVTQPSGKTTSSQPTTSSTTSLQTQFPGETMTSLVYASVFTLPEYLSQLKTSTGITLNPTLGSAGTIGTQIVASKGQGYDTGLYGSTFSKLLQQSSPSVVQPIPVSSIPRWTPDNIAPLFQDPVSVLGDVLGGHVKKDFWWPGQEGKQFMQFPELWGADSLGFNPEFVDKPLTSWGDMVDRQWAGKVSVCDFPGVTVNVWALYLEKTKQMSAPAVIDNLAPSEIDTVVNYLIKQKDAGQFKAYWVDAGSSINQVTSKEVYIIDCWNACVYGVRGAGTPFYYITPAEGHPYWQSGESVLSGVAASRLPVVNAEMNFRLSGLTGFIMAGIAYQSPSYVSKETKDAMGPEFYGWNFLGKATYKPISAILPNQSEWTAQALFNPATYQWSPLALTPDPKGNVKDRGSADDVLANVGTYETWEDNADYYISAWARFKSS